MGGLGFDYEALIIIFAASKAKNNTSFFKILLKRKLITENYEDIGLYQQCSGHNN